MKAYIAKTPKLVQRMFPERVWGFPKEKDTVYLSFDDGPIPEVTPWVLDRLKEHNAKATFFCIGENISKHPEIFKRILEEGHAVGNHTFNHLNGWQTETDVYLSNVEQCEVEFKKFDIASSKANNSTTPKLFRPPYGRLKNDQSKLLQDLGYSIIMWDVLSGDFDVKISEEKCFQNVADYIAPGSIVVFHDSLKSEKNIKYALPKVLELIASEGWSCQPISKI